MVPSTRLDGQEYYPAGTKFSGPTYMSDEHYRMVVSWILYTCSVVGVGGIFVQPEHRYHVETQPGTSAHWHVSYLLQANFLTYKSDLLLSYSIS